MLGTEINKDVFDMIGNRVTLEDATGPIEVVIVDIVSGAVLCEKFTGEISTVPIEEFKKICKDIQG